MTRSEDSPSIESVGAFARQLRRRARDAGTDFVDLAIAIHNLKNALKHLEAEARDYDSPLYSQADPATSSGTQNSAYSRQLRSLVEDSDFALKQVDTVLGTHGEGPRTSAVGRNLDRGETIRKIDLIRGDIVSQCMKIDIFLDTVQLHSGTKLRPRLADVDRRQMEVIKNKVDAIANRLFQERNDYSPVEADEEELWRSFKKELEREGFSPEVLQNNKEVLRAYIRELESHQLPGDGTPPSVRGLLHGNEKPSMTVQSAPYPTDDEEARMNLNPASRRNEGRRRVPRPERTDSILLDHAIQQLSFEQSSSSDLSDTESTAAANTALISTRDLMALDRYCDGKVPSLTGVGASLLPPARAPFYFVAPGTSPDTRHLPSGTQPLPIPGAVYPGHDGQPVTLPPPHPSALSPGTPPPPYGSSLSASSRDASWDLATLSASALTTAHDLPQPPHLPSRQYSRLAPDSKGQTIPLDATWTKINRKLVSPEVLEEAGVRYEARPSFVAVLGVLTREQIEDYARRSFEVRRARGFPGKTRTRDTERQHGAGRQETYRDYYGRRGTKGGGRGGGGGDREAVRRDHEPEPVFDASDISDDEDNGRRRGFGQSRSRDRYTPKNYVPDEHKPLDSEDEEGGKVYPTIVSPPASVDSDSLSPSSTVGPKPILKNKNPNHVRFGRSGPREISPGHYSERPRDRERDRPMPRGRERDRDRYRRDRSRDVSRDRSRVTDRDRNRDHDRDRDRDKDFDYRSSLKRHSDRERDRDRDRDRDRFRDRDRDRNRDRDRDLPRRGEEDRPSRRAALKDAAGAIGVSGAAATLLSVLTQAVTHL
ncbi:uncharacterized protein P884DRAFT_188877 [Thermothelomyces heterothallicus CBS 202.75]|uniref:uncharacterized protein n=1 Tax=Thermothelomyces heterothallicus CBS 202.75 TaxID=1149848 RepID=UPI003744257E